MRFLVSFRSSRHYGKMIVHDVFSLGFFSDCQFLVPNGSPTSMSRSMSRKKSLQQTWPTEEAARCRRWQIYPVTCPGRKLFTTAESNTADVRGFCVGCTSYTCKWECLPFISVPRGSFLKCSFSFFCSSDSFMARFSSEFHFEKHFVGSQHAMRCIRTL